MNAPRLGAAFGNRITARDRSHTHDLSLELTTRLCNLNPNLLVVARRGPRTTLNPYTPPDRRFHRIESPSQCIWNHQDRRQSVEYVLRRFRGRIFRGHMPKGEPPVALSRGWSYASLSIRKRPAWIARAAVLVDNVNCHLNCSTRLIVSCRLSRVCRGVSQLRQSLQAIMRHVVRIVRCCPIGPRNQPGPAGVFISQQQLGLSHQRNDTHFHRRRCVEDSFSGVATNEGGSAVPPQLVFDRRLLAIPDTIENCMEKRLR